MSLSGNRDGELDTLELELEAAPPAGYTLFDDEGSSPQPEPPHSPSDRRSGARLRRFSAILRRRPGIFVFTLLAVIALTTIYVLYRPPVFRSEAVMEVRDHPKRHGKTGQRSVSAGSGEMVATEVGVLRGRGIAQSLVDRLDPQAAAELRDHGQSVWGALLKGPLRGVTALWGGDSSATQKEASRSKLVDRIRDRLSVRQDSASRLLRITFEAGDPVVAQKVLQTYVDIYLERLADSWQRPAGQTGDLLKEQTREAEERLSLSRAALKEFETKHEVKALEQTPAELLQRVDLVLANLVAKVKGSPKQESSPSKKSEEALSQADRERLRSLRNQLSTLETRHLKISELYAETFPPVESMRKQIELLREKIAQAGGREGQPAAAPHRDPAGLQISELEATIKNLVADQALITRYALLKQEVKTREEISKRLAQDAAAAEPLARSPQSGVVLVDKPSLPIAAAGTSSALIVLLGACFGLLGGVFAAVLADRLDGRIHSTEDIDASLGIRVLGSVPDVGKLKKPHRVKGEVLPHEFLAVETTGTPISAAIKNVKTSLGLSNPDFPIGSLVVSSAVQGEGKTFLAVSLATVISSTDRRILLVDSDLRRPRIGPLFGQSASGPGLTTLISQEGTKLPDVLHRSRIPGFFYIAAGELPLDPVTLLESDRFQEVLRRFRRLFDLVIFDSPPLIGHPDARILAANTDGLVLAIQRDRLPAQVIGQAVSTVASAGGKILGAVLTRANAVASYYGNTFFDYEKYYKVGRVSGSREATSSQQLD